MNQQAAVGMDHLAENSINSDLSQGRGVVQVADHLSTHHPQVVLALTNSLRGKTR
jgi:hypothetical protein